MDFDLHGLVGVRCIDARPGDLAAVRRQLGPLGCELDREPDVRIRFVDRLPLDSELRLLEVDDVAFTKDAFILLRGKQKSRTMVQIPFDRIGDTCEIVCQRGAVAVPLLIAIINATAVARGVLPLHAAAFVHSGTGALVTGWSKGGKTETLLAFMSRGARYVGDEWVYLAAGGRMYGIPEPIRVWRWHLEHLPDYRRRLPRRQRLLLAGLGAAADIGSRALERRWLRESPPGRLLVRALPLLRKQLHVDWAPEELFGASREPSATLDRIFFVGSHEAPEIQVSPVPTGDVAARMGFSLQYERSELLAYYRKFRFAFPDRASPLLDRIEELERELLNKLLEGKPAWSVMHPYPVEFQGLYEALRPLL